MKSLERNLTHHDCCLYKQDYDGENFHGGKHQQGIERSFSNMAGFLSNTPFQ